MKKITGFFENKRSIAGLFILSALIFNTYNIQENSGKIKHLSNFESGVQTCFGRVSQTYTAKILGDSASDYLTQNFQNLTEECFAEGILNVEDSFKADLSSVAKKLSTLASNVHWLHEDILSPVNSNKLVNVDNKANESRDVGSRFEKIEMNKDEILEISENYKSEITGLLNNEKIVFYVLSTLMVVLMLFEYFSSTKKQLLNKMKENEASAELLDNGGTVSVKVGDIIKSVLEQNGLINCSKLFSNYYSFLAFDRSIKIKQGMDLENLIAPKVKEVKSQIDTLWDDDQSGIVLNDLNDLNDLKDEKLDDINFEILNANVLDLFSDKVLSQGIKLESKIPKDLKIRSKQEELEQALYHLMCFVVSRTEKSNGKYEIALMAQKLGEVVVFDLDYFGKGFDEELLSDDIGSFDVNKFKDIDLKISQTLLVEVGAKLQFDTKLNQKGKKIGGRFKIIFKASLKDSARLVDLKVGTKKEVLASLKTNESFI